MQQLSDIRGRLARSVRENALPVGLVAVYVGVSMALARHYGFGLRMAPGFNLWLFGVFYFLIASAGVLWLFATERPESPLRLLADLPRRWRLGERFIFAAPVLLAMAVFFPVFSSMKSAIPAMSSYTLDPLFARMDVVIHGGHAWELLHPVFGYPVVTYLINGLYHLWLPAFYIALCSVAVWIEQPELRRRFLIAFVLTWALLGNLAATLLASVGPCFYWLFYPDDPYGGLMDYLRQADQVLPLAALDVQETLVAWWQEGTPGLGRGISAMPSVHVAVACLLTLLCWRLGRVMAWLGTLFLVGILVGSVHLGYHYAIDGYFSIIGAAAIWWLSKPLANLKPFAWPKLAQGVAS